MTDPVFVLKDVVTGRYRPGRYTYAEAHRIAEDDGFLVVRRLDEALAERTRGAN